MELPIATFVGHLAVAKLPTMIRHAPVSKNRLLRAKIAATVPSRAVSASQTILQITTWQWQF